MDLFGIGTGEVLLIVVVALIIWGPGRIIEISRSLGKMVHNLKKAASDLTEQISKETEEQEKKRPPQ
jgi:Tat protein translocase TatB subunit